jgi:hypothetical protein
MKKIGVLKPEQGCSDSPSFYEKKSVVHRWIKRAEAVWIIPGCVVQLIEAIAKTIEEVRRETTGFFDGPIGVGNLIPFVKPHSSGDRLHYEIPHAGDRSIFARHRRRLIRVSSRNLFSKQLIAV